MLIANPVWADWTKVAVSDDGVRGHIEAPNCLYFMRTDFITFVLDLGEQWTRGTEKLMIIRTKLYKLGLCEDLATRQIRRPRWVGLRGKSPYHHSAY